MKDIRNSKQFYYTQQSLSAFASCPLRFKKRYMEGFKWDRRPDKEVKASLERGNNFHLLARRYFLGVPSGLTESTRDCIILAKWMQNLEQYFQISPDAKYYPEYTLRTNIHGFQLEANFDLVVYEDGNLTIWDWKTHNENEDIGLNRRSILEKSLQTMVYLYTLNEQSSLFTGKLITADNLCMKYWQPDPPQIIAEVKYDDVQHEKFLIKLQNTISTIQEYDYSTFNKALYTKNCKHCEFYFYCNKNDSL